MKNANKPAYPTNIDYKGRKINYLDGGFTKYEKTCIDLGIPNTGDEEIDKLIRQAQRRTVALKVIQGLLAWDGVYRNKIDVMANMSLEIADELLNNIN